LFLESNVGKRVLKEENTEVIKELKGRVFNIQRYSLHDGPGIRTVVFLKGCPLSCAWCCNPESIDRTSHITFSPQKCIGDGRCVEVCRTGARDAEGYHVELCTFCGLCVEVCPTGALELVGRDMSVEDVVREVEKDRLFYESSGGGMTLSGGEDLAQRDFGVQLLRACRQRMLHTAIETTGFAPWDHVLEVAGACDLVLYDLKHMDPEIHRRYTGVSNDLILENARRLAKVKEELIFRVPLIGGVNTDENNIRKLAEFVKGTAVEEVHLLPYHRLGESKYSKLGRKYTCEGFTPEREKVEEIQHVLQSYHLKVMVGG
jgi:pyruvate formate lyase activating enzyme